MKKTDKTCSNEKNRYLLQHAPMTKKDISERNDKPFMTRALRKATMLRSRLRNKYNEDRTAENWNKQRYSHFQAYELCYQGSYRKNR